MKLIKKICGFLLVAMLATQVYADSIITGSKPYTFIPGTVISSSQVNADFDYIINQTNTNAAKNGVNSSITALLGLTTPIPISGGGSSYYYATTVGGTVDAITVSTTIPAISSFSLTPGVSVAFVPTGTNTISGPTLNVNGTGAIVLKRISSGSGVVNLRPNELPGNIGINTGLVYAIYDGTQWIVQNAPALFGLPTSIASAATTDLGFAGGRFALVTGSTNITSFGSTCSLGFPIYLVKFSGNPVITFNAVSLITPGLGNLVMAPNDSLLAECLGGGNWRILTVFYSVPVFALGGTNGLTITNNSGTPTTQLTVTTLGLSALEGVSNFATDIIGPVSLTINAATTGVNGLDTGALANNTWYYIYIISDGASLNGGLLSTSSSAPTMPTGYVFKYRVGAVRTLGAATFIRFIQKGNQAQYQVVAGSTTPNLPIMASGALGSPTVPTWSAVATGSYVPTTAIRLQGLITGTPGLASNIIVAPNNAYGAVGSLTNPPIASFSSSAGTNVPPGIPYDLTLESTNIFWASSNAASAIAIKGWTDIVNAN